MGVLLEKSMENNRSGKKLDLTFLILAALVFTAVAVAFWRGGWQLTLLGLMQAGQLVEMIWLRLILGLTLAGLVQVLVPRELIAKWLGHTSGLRGILIGSYIGILMPGGPYVMLPLIASIYRAGAGVGPVIALLTGRALLGIQMLIVWQIPFLGVEIPLARYIACLFLPPLVGLAGGALFRIVTGLSPGAAGTGDGGAGTAGELPDVTGKAGKGLASSEEEGKVEEWT